MRRTGVSARPKTSLCGHCGRATDVPGASTVTACTVCSTRYHSCCCATVFGRAVKVTPALAIVTLSTVGLDKKLPWDRKNCRVCSHCLDGHVSVDKMLDMRTVGRQRPGALSPTQNAGVGGEQEPSGGGGGDDGGSGGGGGGGAGGGGVGTSHRIEYLIKWKVRRPSAPRQRVLFERHSAWSACCGGGSFVTARCGCVWPA